MIMAEKTEKKNGKKIEEEMSKEEFFEAKNKEALQNQWMSIIQGFFILGLVVIFDYFVLFSYFGIVGILAGLLLAPTAFFLVMYFIWGKQDVGWACFPREGYTKPILIGNQLLGFAGLPSGKAFTDDWDVVEATNPKASSKNKDINFWGMHIIPLWPFAKVYWEKTEWERWYPNQKKAVPRRELLREFTLLPYPYYVKVTDAEDQNRLQVTIESIVVMKIVNPKKALFRQATTWIDIIKPLIQGGYISYIKGTTFQAILQSKKDVGSDLLKGMQSPEDTYRCLKDMILDVYGIEIESISVLDVAGSDEEEQKAINAMAVAKLNRSAALINADSYAQKSAIETTGYAIKMLAQMIAKNVSEGEDQGNEWREAENRLKIMLEKEPAKFELQYGEKFKQCIDFVHRRMALDKGKFVDIRTPDSKGSTGDLMSMIMASKLVDVSSGGGAKSSDGEKKEGKKGKDDLPFPGYEF
jgi:regulator of protease activity HflC (stomatin/prohibitin superfamily)